MKSERRPFTIVETLLLGAMILGYLAAIFCINLSVTPSCYTTDMYTDIMVAVEMWEEKNAVSF